MKKIALLSFVVIFALISVNVTAVAEEKVEIEFWTILLADAFGDYINGMIDEYEAANPNVEIKWYDTGEPITEYMTSLASGNPPDVANMHHPRDFAARGVIWNLDELLTEEQQDTYIDNLYLYGEGEYEGGHYAIPWYGGSASGMFYNREIFEAAGLDPDQPPKTTKEMYEFANIIAKNTDKYGLSWDTCGWHEQHVIDVLVWEDVELLNEDKTEAVINNPKAVDVLNTLIESYEVGGIPPEAVSSSGRDTLNWFLEERTAMFVQGGWIKRYISDDLMEKIEYVKVPLGRDGSRVTGTPNWIIISKASEHPEIAADFATFVTNTENQVEFCKLVAITPTTKDALEDPFFQQEPENFNQLAQQLAIEQLQEDVPQNMLIPQAENWAEMLTILKEEVDRALIGNQTTEETLENVERRWNSLL